MRKLLVLTAILFMAPIAAGMTVSLNDTGTTVELSVFGHGEPDYIHGIAMVIEAPGVLSNFVDGPKAALLWYPYSVTINGDSGQWMHMIVPITDDDGVWLIADFSAPVPVWVSAYIEREPGSGWVLMDQIQVPEPTTITLLGIGGLFLLRQRRIR